MKRLFAVGLALLMLLSVCLVGVSASPARVIITACDSLEGWSNNDKPFDTSNVPEPVLNADLDDYPVVSFTYVGPAFNNGGSNRPDVTAHTGMKISYTSEQSYDLTGMNYFIFDLYVSNAAAIRNTTLYLELTSSGAPDKEETGFKMSFEQMKGSELVDGWNHIELALSASNSKLGETNWSAWNFMRIYNGDAFDAGEGLTIAFKNIYFCEESPTVAAAKAAATTIAELFASIADVSTGDITAENYETVKAQLAAATEAFNAAEIGVQAAVEETCDVGKIERNVTRALEKYEASLNTPAEPDVPAEPETPDTPEVPDEPEMSDEPTTDTPDPLPSDTTDEEQGGLNPIVIAVIAVAVVAVVVVIVLVAKKKK